jgi:hypothetical protein
VIALIMSQLLMDAMEKEKERGVDDNQVTGALVSG